MQLINYTKKKPKLVTGYNARRFLTSLLCTLVKLNFSRLKGWEILLIASGCLRLLNLISFNYSRRNNLICIYLYSIIFKIINNFSHDYFREEICILRWDKFLTLVCTKAYNNIWKNFHHRNCHYNNTLILDQSSLEHQR